MRNAPEMGSPTVSFRGPKILWLKVNISRNAIVLPIPSRIGRECTFKSLKLYKKKHTVLKKKIGLTTKTVQTDAVRHQEMQKTGEQ